MTDSHENIFKGEHPIAAKLRHKTQREVEFSHMLTSPEQAQFLAFLIQMLQARSVIEIGVFTGYTTLVMAQALPENGELIACDISEQWTQVGKPFWQAAGVDHKIQLHIAKANETLQFLREERGANAFDFVYIDADKICYDQYYEQSLSLVRQGGVIALDDMLRVANVQVSSRQNPATKALDDLTCKLYNDTRVIVSLLSMGDGLLLAKKR